MQIKFSARTTLTGVNRALAKIGLILLVDYEPFNPAKSMVFEVITLRHWRKRVAS